MAKTIEVRVTEEEHEILEQLARLKGFDTISKYMKATALKPPRNRLEKLPNPFTKAG